MENGIRAVAGLIFAAWLIWFCFWATEKPEAQPAANDAARIGAPAIQPPEGRQMKRSWANVFH